MRLTGFTVMILGLLGLILWHVSTGAPSDQDQPVLLAQEVRLATPFVPNDVESGNPPKQDQAVEGFKFPDDQSGLILAKILPPSGKTISNAQPLPAKPRLLPAPHALEHPPVQLPPPQVDVARLPQTKRSILKPRPVSEELPILASRLDPTMPQPRVLPAEGRVRIASVDPRQSVPLAVLASPVIDRVSVEDVTSDVSLAGALSSPPPVRTSPAVYIKISVPDPFENRLKMPVGPEEIQLPNHTGSKPAK
jgi:hypothetical protein